MVIKLFPLSEDCSLKRALTNIHFDKITFTFDIKFGQDTTAQKLSILNSLKMVYLKNAMFSTF